MSIMLLKLLIIIIISANLESALSSSETFNRPNRRNFKQNPAIIDTNWANSNRQIDKTDRNRSEIGADFFQRALNDLNKNNERTQRRSRNRRKHHEITTTATINATNPINYNKKTRQNRCQLKNGGCSQKCLPKGKRKCACFDGYRLAKDRKTCTDINECKLRNRGGCSDHCVNQIGSYQCRCPAGFRLRDDRKTCEDINECLLRNGHGPCDDVCENTYGSYMCHCKRNGTRLSPNQHQCDDINECQEGISGCSHICMNAYGRYYCTCPVGMVLNSDWRTCQDIDECKVGLAKDCDKTYCINTIGSYICDIGPAEYRQVNTVCPPLYPPKHGYFECFRNVRLKHFTRTGRPLIVNHPGLRCHLKCPIGYKLYGNSEFVCSRYGRWINTNKGTCIKMSKPYLRCPPDQIVYRKFGETELLVRFPRPITNVNWELVKSYPSWAKNFKKSLKPGNYFISFAVNHPTFSINFATKCSFTIRVI